MRMVPHSIELISAALCKAVAPSYEDWLKIRTPFRIRSSSNWGLFRITTSCITVSPCSRSSSSSGLNVGTSPLNSAVPLAELPGCYYDFLGIWSLSSGFTFFEEDYAFLSLDFWWPLIFLELWPLRPLLPLRCENSSTPWDLPRPRENAGQTSSTS